MEAAIPLDLARLAARVVDGLSPNPSRPGTIRVVVANEPRAYREVTVEVLGQLRPDVEFSLVEPAGLEAEISRLRPDMVVCDVAIPAVREGVPVWLELYPGGDARSNASVHGEASTIEDAQLADIIGLVDRAAEMPHDSRKDPRKE